MSRLYFHPGEIFAMAQEIERQGAQFYRKASEKAALADMRALLLELAAMEDDHEKTFASLKAELPLQEGREAPQDEEAAQYLQAWADGHVFDPKTAPSQQLTGKETKEEILGMAIGLEKDSIAFYVGIKQAIPPEWGQAKIDTIIKEEMGHIRLLDHKLTSWS
jgi:rubrerythrin